MGLYEQEALGNYTANRDGMVYSAFDRKENVRAVARDSRKPVMWSLDFNVEPMCSVVAQRDGDEFHLLDEIVLHRSCTSEACEECDRRYPYDGTAVEIYGDASGNRRQTAGTSDWEIVRTFFQSRGRRMNLHTGRSNPPVRERVAKLNGYLKNAAGETRLLVDPRCRELIKDLELVRYGKNGEIDKGTDAARTHLSDALGYLVWEESGPQVAMGEQPHSLL
jgi:hypothetical protein